MSTTTAAIGLEATPDNVPSNFDGAPRPIGSAPDVGTDEYATPSPAAVTGLRVSHAVTAPTILTATLTWPPHAGAITATPRASKSLINAGNWSAAAP